MIELKQIYTYLIRDGYVIKKRVNLNEKYGYCLYDRSNNPVTAIHSKLFGKIAHLLKKKKGVYTLNLNTVRQQNGHATVKRIYKEKNQASPQPLSETERG
jgi:hypothetical protein